MTDYCVYTQMLNVFPDIHGFVFLNIPDLNELTFTLKDRSHYFYIFRKKSNKVEI